MSGQDFPEYAARASGAIMAAGPCAVPAADQRRLRRGARAAGRRRAGARTDAGERADAGRAALRLGRFWQPWIAASSAAARVGLVEPPQILPSSVIAMAPHSFGPSRKTTLQAVVLQLLIAASSACFWFASFQLKPYLPLASSWAKAP